MPDWVKGNFCWMNTSRRYELGTSTKVRRYGINGQVVNQGISQLLTQFMFQPGIVRGLNMYVGLNTSVADIDISFIKEVYTSPTSYGSEIDHVLFTIPSGETGYFCAKPILTNDAGVDLANRSWARWDKAGIKIERSTIGLLFLQITLGVCLEITEEELTDTTGTNRLPV